MLTLSKKIYLIVFGSSLVLTAVIFIALGLHIHYYQVTLNPIIIVITGVILSLVISMITWYYINKVITRRWQKITEVTEGCISKEIDELVADFNHLIEKLGVIGTEIKTIKAKSVTEKTTNIQEEIRLDNQKNFLYIATEEILCTELPKGLNKATLQQVANSLHIDKFPISVEEVAEGANISRVTVRRYLEYLEIKGLIVSRLKYGTVGRPVKLYDLKSSLFDK